MKEGNQNYYICPIYDTNGEIIVYEVYSDECTKCIERWRVVKE